jgi:hypothetical protein
MIHSITVTNHRSESLKIELTRPEESGFIVLSADGLIEPVKATINSSRIANLDGTVYNSSYLDQRDIVLNLLFMEGMIGNEYYTIEDIRLKSYQYFPERKPIKLTIETDNYLVETSGYVEHNKPTVFSANEGTSITILCNDPFLYSTEPEVVMFSGVLPKFSFPFSNPSTSDKLLVFGHVENRRDGVVYYDGQADAGMLITIHAVGEVSNLTLYNLTCDEKMSIDTTKLALLTGNGIIPGDTILIDTRRRQKSITLIREGVRTNIINCLERGTAWLSLTKGDNRISYRASTEDQDKNVQFSIEYRNAYEGV